MHFFVTERFKLLKTLIITIINKIFEKRNFTVYFMVKEAPHTLLLRSGTLFLLTEKRNNNQCL